MFLFSSHSSNRRGSVMSDLDSLHGMPDGPNTKREEYVEGNIKKGGVIDCESEVMCVRYSQDGSIVAAGLADGNIKILNPDTGQVLFCLSDEDTKKSRLPVTSIRFKPWLDGSKVEHTHILIATYASGLIKTWHYQSPNSPLSTVNEIRQTLALALNPQVSKFLTSGADPQLNLYDMETRQRIRVLEPSDSRDTMNGHRARVFAVQYHPLQPHIFISGGWDDTVQFWDDRTNHAVRKLYGPHICGDGLDIDAAHNHILTSSWRKDRVLQIWDFGSGGMIKDVPQDTLHSSLLYCGQWLGKENIVVGGCEQNMARVIDRGTLNTVGQLVDLPSGVFCIDNDRQSNKPNIVLGSAKKVYVLKMEKKQN